MDIEKLIEKFEHYAITLKSVMHDPSDRFSKAFINIDLEDLQSAAIDGMKFPAILLQTPEASKSGDSHDNMYEHISFTFIVLDNNVSKTKSQLIKTSKAIADCIYNRLFLDIQEDSPIYGVITGTDEGVFGPMGNIYGWAVSVEIRTPYDGELQINDWTDLEEGVQP